MLTGPVRASAAAFFEASPASSVTVRDKVSNMRQIQHLGLQTGPKMNTSQATRGIKTSVGEYMKPEKTICFIAIISLQSLCCKFINNILENATSSKHLTKFIMRTVYKSVVKKDAKILAITFESKENNQP